MTHMPLEQWRNYRKQMEMDALLPSADSKGVPDSKTIFGPRLFLKQYHTVPNF